MASPKGPKGTNGRNKRRAPAIRASQLRGAERRSLHDKRKSAGLNPCLDMPRRESRDTRGAKRRKTLNRAERRVIKFKQTAS